MFKGSTGRLRLISILFASLSLIFIGRLFVIQIINGADYRERADHQYVQTVPDNLARGDIYFTDKDGNPATAATINSGYLLAINPTTLISAEDAYKKLSAITPIDRGNFMQRAGKTGDPYEVITGRLSSDVADKINALKLKGVILARDTWRTYPGSDLAAHILGFMGYQGDEYTGQYGLEEYYDDILTKESNTKKINFFAELFTNLKNTFSTGQESGGNIYTTIEPTVQSYVEEQLKSYMKKWQPQFNGAVVINPQTGAIIAMAINPTFDPNNFQKESSNAVFADKLVSDSYEMGSIMKAVTMAIGLDTGVVTPETTYKDTACIKVSGFNICNWDGKAHGTIPMQQVLNQSLNIGAAFVESKIGNQTFANYLRAFGLGKKTGIDLPDEAIGLISNLNHPEQVGYTTASFGQGIAMTPMQTVRALSVLANGGKLITPHLVSKIQYGLKTKEIDEPPAVQVIKPQTAETITSMLVKVMDEVMASGDNAMTHYSIAVKTGTAQIADSVNGGYLSNIYLHSFFGYFPAYNPEVLVFLFAYKPRGAEFASQTLTQPFMNLATFLIHYYDMPPDR